MNKPEFVYVVYLAATPDQVWEGLTNGDFTQQYWGGLRIQSDWAVGSPVTHVTKDGTVGLAGEIVEADRPRVLAYTFHMLGNPEKRSEPPSLVRFEIESVGAMVKLTLTHDHFESDGSATFQDTRHGWPAIMSSLKSLLETGTPLPFTRLGFAPTQSQSAGTWGETKMTSTPIEQRGYARPELLTDTEWLASHLDDPRVRIIDARGQQQYDEGHIPGAAHMDGFGSNIPRAENADMGDPQSFEQVASGLGIDNDMTVVVYDTPQQRMGMVAWTFMYYAQRDIRILDGGFEKWSTEHRATTTDVPSYPATIYEANPVAEVYCSLEQAKTAQGRADFVFWDTRSTEEYEGTASGYGTPPRPGHIPGAAHLDWNELLDPQTKTFKPAAELTQMLESVGITPDKEVASYCNGGARGALGGFVLQLLGYDRGRTYAGSFAQWSRQSDTPVEQ